MKNNNCQFCNSEDNITFHHLIPKTFHSRKKFKRDYSNNFLNSYGIYLCRKCHDYIHKNFTEKELAENLNSYEKLMLNDKILAFIQWKIKQKN